MLLLLTVPALDGSLGGPAVPANTRRAAPSLCSNRSGRQPARPHSQWTIAN